MIQVTENISIDENDIHYDFIRASGPGGQHVNKVSTAVQLRYDIKNSPSLPPYVKHRLTRLAGRRLTKEGTIIIEAQAHRYQERNRLDALNKLISLIQKAAKKPKKRVKTKPSSSSVQRRIDSKKQQSKKKQSRQRVNRNDY